MKKLRGSIERNLDEETLSRIKAAPKPTKVAEALAVAKEFRGKALDLSEIAEVANIANPGREEKSNKDEYPVEEMRKHPDLRVLSTPKGAYVRYTGE